MATQTKCCENVQFGWRPPGEGDPQLPEGENILFCASCGTDWGPGIIVPIMGVEVQESPLPPIAAGDDVYPAMIARLDAILLNQGKPSVGGGGGGGGDGVYHQAWTNLLEGLDNKASWGKNMLREFLLECFVAAGGEAAEAEEEESGEGNPAE